MSLNRFSNAAVADGTNVTSYINASNLVSAIQSDYADSFLDSTSKLGKVCVYYSHSLGREQKKLVHTGLNLSTTAQWSPYAQDGTWQKIKVKAFDKEGAFHTLNRGAVGSGEDVTHSSGYIYLNTI